MVSWPELGTRVAVRYRRPAGSVPPLTDVIGHLLETTPLVRVQTKTGAVIQFAAGDVVALRPLSDTPVRASEIRALEHADAMAWPGVERHWQDGWLLRAGYGTTRTTRILLCHWTNSPTRRRYRRSSIGIEAATLAPRLAARRPPAATAR